MRLFLVEVLAGALIIAATGTTMAQQTTPAPSATPLKYDVVTIKENKSGSRDILVDLA